MTFEDAKPIARQLAENSLARGFDAEAFLILSMLKDEGHDAGADKSKELYTIYMEDRTAEHLGIYLTMIYRIVSEVYHSSDTEGERQAVCDFVCSLEKIVKK